MAVVATAQEEFPQHFPQSGWVEHDPDDIWSTVAATCRGAIERAGARRRRDIAAIGITNQRETTLVWERATGRPLGRAIVWQDRRTAALCAELRAAGHEAMITERDRAAARPLLLRHQAQVAARRARGRAGAGAAGRAPVRHRRQLPDLEADRRAGRTSPTRPTPRARCSTTSTTAPGTPRSARSSTSRCEMLPEVRDCAADFGDDPRRPLRPRDPDPRRRRRPAGGDGRAGLLRARHAEVDLRHRLLRGAQHRRRRRSRAATGC